ncbi:hypothetical protein O181_035666 [Austropuccinia psidii MF-1]|uniref:Uncharacterized protein n=1 Tax=Austropuccinia psidii MF-1 TaxID=1389203 RepID=A0A9Q3D8Q1_9BASI|nr:hypothetical protein [Austropuccinia psidii MF-1]
MSAQRTGTNRGPELFPASNSRNIPVSVQELVYGSKTAGAGASAKSLDRHNELLYSSEKVDGPRKDSRPSAGLEIHVFQKKSPKDKSLVEKPNHFSRGPGERVGPKEGQQPSGSSSSLQKKESRSTSAKQGQESPKEQSEGKGKVQSEQALPTELHNSKERKDSYGQCVQNGKNSYGIQTQGRRKIESILSK